MSQYFDDIGFNGYDYIMGVEVPETENYSTAFIMLGIYSGNYVLQESDVAGFTEILNNGGNVYLEGSDTWAFDSQTSLQGMFGLTGISDGTADLISVIGSEGSFAEGLYMSYDGGNSYIDQLAPAGGFALLENDVADYITAIGYDNDIYRTVGASHELGGLQGDDFSIYVDGIIEFFEEGGGNINPQECVVGDVNEDGEIDVIDIIRVVSIIINSGDPASDIEICASDINADNSIDILDVLVLINIILDDDLLSRLEIINEVILSVSDTQLELKTNGAIKGLEFIIQSDLELHLNSEIGMDIAYNVVDDYHYILIYSMDGNYMIGDYELFTTTMEYEIIDFKAVNSNYLFVDVLYDEVIVPSSFILKQNYPNPFNPSTTIDVELSQSDNISLIIYDINGRKISTLADGYYQVGNHSFIWNGMDDFGSKISSGIYVYTLVGSNQLITKTMVLLK